MERLARFHSPSGGLRILVMKPSRDQESILMDVGDEVLWLAPSVHVCIALVTKSLLGTSHDTKP